MLGYLLTVPAILGLSGFIIFQVLKSRSGDNEITSEIVAELRTNHPEKFTENEKLSPKQLHELLSRDQDLQSEIGDQDLQLLGQIMRHQHVQSLVVYGISALLFIIGIAAFLYQMDRPQPTLVSNISLQSVVSEA